MIKLQSFTIRNYRSIKELTFQLDRIAAFVGYNNAGKTNCLRAISMALSFEKPSVSDFRTGCNEIQFEYTLSGFVDGVLDKVFSNKESLDKTKRIKLEKLIHNNSLKIRIISTLEHDKVSLDTYCFDGNEWKVNPTGIPSALKAVVPDVYVLNVSGDSADQARIKSGTLFGKLMGLYFGNSISESMRNKLNQVLDSLENDESIHRLQEDVDKSLSEFYPDFKSHVQHALKSDDVYKTFKLQFENASGDLLDVTEYGHGLQRSAELALLNCVANMSFSTEPCKASILLVDEPELFQHPAIINKIRNVFLKLSRGFFQVALSTHSANMIQHLDILNNTHIVRTSKDKGTYFLNDKNPNLSTDKNDCEDSVSSSALDTVCSLDALSSFPFSEVILLVEGNTEKLFFTELLRDLLPSCYAKIGLIIVDGCSQLSLVNEILVRFGIPSFIIGDLDAIKTLKAYDEVVGELVNDMTVTMKEFFNEKYSSCLDANGWPGQGKSAEAFAQFAEMHKAKVSDFLSHLKTKSVILWYKGDIEHTLYPMCSKDKVKAAGYVINHKNNNIVKKGDSEIEAWRRIIKHQHGDWDCLIDVLLTVFDSVLTEAERELLISSK